MLVYINYPITNPVRVRVPPQPLTKDDVPPTSDGTKGLAPDQDQPPLPRWDPPAPLLAPGDATAVGGIRVYSGAQMDVMTYDQFLFFLNDLF